MRPVLSAFALVVALAFAPVAMAQVNSPPGAADTPSSAQPGPSAVPTAHVPRQAPVGARQPTAQDVEGASRADPANAADLRRERDIDRKIRSICRGC